MYCFDTDVVAAALLQEPPLSLVRRLGRTAVEEQCTTAVTVGEIAYAAARSGDEELIGRLRDLVAAASRILPFDDTAGVVYGSLRMRLERVGVRLDEPSLRIASIALAHDLTLVTGSARLYDRVPNLRIENWLEPDELETAVEREDGDAPREKAAPVFQGDGTVRHPGHVSGHEARGHVEAEPDTESAQAGERDPAVDA